MSLSEQARRAASGGWLARSALRADLVRLATGDERGRENLRSFLRAATPQEWVGVDEAMRVTLGRHGTPGEFRDP